MGSGIASWDNYLIHDKCKNSKKQHPSHSFVYRCVANLNQKSPSVNFCFFLKFNNKPIFDYQNVHLLYGPIWKNLNLKGKNAGNTVKCQANFLTHLLWSSIDKFTYYNLKRLIPSLCPLSSGGQRTDCCLGLQISKGGKKCHKWWLWQMNI